MTLDFQGIAVKLQIMQELLHKLHTLILLHAILVESLLQIQWLSTQQPCDIG